MKKKLREQLDELTLLAYGVSFDDVEARKDFIESIVQIVRNRDIYVVGGNEWTIVGPRKIYSEEQQARNNLRQEQRQRSEETL